MANINDFKLVARKSDRYADILLNETQGRSRIKDPKRKERMGFYLFILENVCGIQDIIDLKYLVTDTEFNHLVLGEEKKEDYGIDAVYIDEEEYSISLFNFKYREKFNPNKAQGVNEPFIST